MGSHHDHEGPFEGIPPLAQHMARAWFGRGRFRPEGGGRGPGWPPSPPGFPPGWPFGRGPGPKVRAGNVRSAILALLSEGPRNGYQIIQDITERSGNTWRPSSGSVYPALQQLEDEGLVRQMEKEGKKLYELTEAGRTYVKAHKEELADPWGEVARTVDSGSTVLHALMARLAVALMQVAHGGTEAQQEKAREIVLRAMREVYGLLSEDPESDE